MRTVRLGFDDDNSATPDIEQGQSGDESRSLNQIIEDGPQNVGHWAGAPPYYHAYSAPYYAGGTRQRHRQSEVRYERGQDGSVRFERRHTERDHAHAHAGGSGGYWGDEGGVLCWTLFAVFAFIFFFILIIGLANTGPYYSYHGYHSGGTYHPHGSYPGYPARQDDPTYRKKHECAVGERWDEKLGLCEVTPRFPSSVDDDLKDVDVSPCVDFERYACGSWDKDPAHVDETRGFTYIARANDRQVSDIVRDPAVEGVHRFYRSCVETVVQGKHQKSNAQERIRETSLILGEFNSLGDLPEVFALLARNAFTAPFALQIENHPKMDKAIPLFRYDGFEGVSEEEVRKVFEAAGDSRRLAIAKAKSVMEIIGHVQQHQPPDIDDYLTYLKSGQLERDIMPWSQFKQMAFGGKFPWDRFLQRLDGHGLRFEEDQDVWVLGREYFEWLEPHEVMDARKWRLYVEFSITYHTSNFFPALPSPSYFRVHHPLRKQHHHARLGRFKRRARSPRDGPDAPDEITAPSEYDCVRATQYLLPGLVSDEFLKRNPEITESFADVEAMTKKIRDAYVEIIQGTPDISDATREATIQKYRSIIVRVGHPKEWRPEPFADRLSDSHFIHNLDMIREYRIQRDLELWREGGVQDRDSATRFGSPLSVVNAFYQPSSNTISILPGILRAPFYHPRYDDSSKYAGIGMVVGHELGHAGDPHGIEFDEAGSLREWWTLEEKESLKERYACVVDKYKAPTQCSGEAAEKYGLHTLGENVADKMGLTATRMAYLGADHAVTVDMPDELVAKNQFFFLSYGQTWCSALSPERQCARVESDVHALQPDRVNVPLRDMPGFHYSWGCAKGSPMVHDEICHVFGE
jgi:hypothetical protein